jgi:tetratricopeptide (TPR) repeat protein
MKGRLSFLLVFGGLAVAWGCQAAKTENGGSTARKSTVDAAVDKLLAEVAADEAGLVKPAGGVIAATESGKATGQPVKRDVSSKYDALFAEMAGKGGTDEDALKRAEAVFLAGKKLFDEQRYEAALEKFRAVLRIHPRHRQAIAYGKKTRAILDIGLDPSKVALEMLERNEQIKVEESLAEIRKVIIQGDRARAEATDVRSGDVKLPADRVLSRKKQAAEKALKAYDRALEIVRWLPYQVDLSSIRRRIKAAKSETRKVIKALDKHLAGYRRRQAEESRLGKIAREERFFRRKINAMLSRAEYDYRQSRFEIAEGICNQVLKIDPRNSRAKELKLSSQDKKHRVRERDTYLRYRLEFRDTMSKIEEATVPHEKVLVYPENWQKVMLRTEKLGMSNETEEEWRTSIKHKLEKKVNFEFVQAPLDEAVGFLQSVSDVNMIIDPVVKAAGERPITLKMTQASLKLALEWILRLADLDYELRDNAVYISTKENLRPETSMVIYDIQDMILEIPDFPGPEMDLQGGGVGGAGGGGGIGGLGGGGGAGAAGPNTQQEIVDMIQQRIRPDSWGPAHGSSIEPRNGKIVVVQRQIVHQMISRLLSDLRSTQKVLVVVEGRLLKIREGLFEDIGVNWGGNSATGGAPATDPGMSYSRGALSTVGSIISNNLSNSADSTPIANSSPLLTGGVPNGGLSAQWDLLSSLQLTAVLHAVRIKENGAELQAPKLVVHNAQRAHMWIGRERSYISGWASSGTNNSPEISQLLTGVVFDVKPIVSANRRYITLELRPTFTELNQMGTANSTVTTPIGGTTGTTLFTTANLRTELPELIVTRVRTSVTIPDGGIILTGGRLRDVQHEAEAGVPFLKDIPFLGRLARWNRKDNERESLAILVTARILLFDEEERKN